MVKPAVQSLLQAYIENMPECSLHFCAHEDELYRLTQGCSLDLVLLDPELVVLNAADSIALVKAACVDCEIVLLLTNQDITIDVELMKIGAYAALANPPAAIDLATLLSGLMAKKEVERENRALIEALGDGKTQTIISHSPEMEKVLSMAARAARSNSTVLISGESGTGKELIARAIHLLGDRKHKPFVPVNIAALPENLIESELFGHIKGSFTGAMADRAGRFSLANGGTLFIDEIGEVPPGIQVKLLRVLQFGSYERVGENAGKTADVRIIAATNRDLKTEVQEGHFRADLYYRINVVPVNVPPLREHKSDIPYLAEYFLKKYAMKNRKRVQGITAEAMARIMRYSFPGNVRELENIIERGMVLCRGDYLTETDIFMPSDDVVTGSTTVPVGSYDEAMSSFEREYLLQVIRRHGGNKSAAAREIGINERRMRYRLKVLDIDTPD
ncbi:MAG: hypothetical protein A2087_14080 [Spirochaetes bacterium GWD1_61_31]|nr:MAG: hypothetical protein A2Y37_02030 [Spirochaetes bacterium GWB1_60_80]OHD33122.1 MAG: hypothetical protein A2004_12315 [Spirochaetes bacterium GWC1_61_12]OHD39588.1 MAG: hypothetical protein A2087_14080 [Spirochaetes bacterium GWD1_61_31]OHD43857.1 MAG: hypothetical protein A2Y35_00380 [Spirochaetes bacterium GWE1_60_18]OHD61176.1 MAG: hypothetical protein A2Y32_03585 [Spirochaetes bacterium GWF1_60_12]